MTRRLRYGAALALVAVVSLISCKQRGADDADLATTDGKVVQQRHHPVRISFDKWGDVIFLDVGTEGDGAICKLLPPSVRDGSTLAPWKVVQVYWLIYDKIEQVEWKSKVNTYFVGDRVDIETMVHLGEKKPMGFLNLTEQHKKHFTIGEVTVSENDTRVQLAMGAPINATIRLQAAPRAEGDGGCEVQAMYAQGGKDFKGLKQIHISQNWLYKPTGVIFK